MKKIVVIGCSGSGKSVMSQKLSQVIDIPLYHLDKIYWKAGWVSTPKNEWDNLLEELIKKESWILDGNYRRTFDIRLEAADTIIFLDMSRLLCITSVVKRFVKFRKTSRPDMNEGCKERLDISFLKWVWHYNKHVRPEVLDKLKDNKNKTIVVLKSRKEIGNFLSDLGQLQ